MAKAVRYAAISLGINLCSTKTATRCPDSGFGSIVELPPVALEPADIPAEPMRSGPIYRTLAQAFNGSARNASHRRIPAGSVFVKRRRTPLTLRTRYSAPRKRQRKTFASQFSARYSVEH